MAKNSRETIHFYRGKNATIVWDKENNRVLCDLSEGHIITDDPRVIRILREMEYIEVPIDAEEPPVIEEPIQPAGMPDAKALPAGLTEKGAALLQAEDHHGPEVNPPKAKPKKKASKPASGKKVSSRKIKRREVNKK